MHTGCRFAGSSRLLFVLALGAARAAVAADIIYVADFENTQEIQWVRHHPHAGGASIDLDPAYVTATPITNGGANVTIYVEVPSALDGRTDYPQWSALKLFGSTSGGVPAVGDCISASGTIALFNGATELTAAVWLVESAAACGNAPIVPASVPAVATVATDTDLVTTGNQPATTAEAYESVLVRMSAYATTSNGGSGGFQAADAATNNTSTLSVAQFLYQYSAVAGTHLSLTGILDEFDSATDVVYQLLPRSAADVVVIP